VETTINRDDVRVLEDARAKAHRLRELLDRPAVIGYGSAILRGPDGKIKAERSFANLITTVGDETYAKRGSGVATPNAPTGMRYGTGTTAVAKSGAGAAIVTYVSGSSLAFDGGFPSAAAIGGDTGWRVTYKRTWAAGIATSNGIAEAVITNESGPTNVAGTAANTIARALLSPVVDKAAGDSLEITWTHDFFDAP
jgi:hypothetical protein